MTKPSLWTQPRAIIGRAEQIEIDKAIAIARHNAYRWQDIKPLALMVKDGATVNLADRKGQTVFPGVPVILQGGYRAAIGFEHHPTGLFRHLSVSVQILGELPNLVAVAVIADAFGFSSLHHGMWLEEFKHGHYAVNVIEPVIEPDTFLKH